MSSASTTSTGMPKITSTTTTSSASASSTSQSWTTPSVTAPSASNNPYVWRSSAPTGTVFIAVGAVAGFILLSLAVIVVISKALAKRTAKNSLALHTDSSASSFNQGHDPEKLSQGPTAALQGGFFSSATNLRKSISQGKIPLLYDEPKYAESFSSLSDVLNNGSEQQFYSTLNSNQENTNKKKSMFISPTAEVMNVNRDMNHHQRMLSSLGNIAGLSDNSLSDITASDDNSQRQNVHERNDNHHHVISYDNYQDVQLQSPERGSRQNRAQNRTVPSAYLESMFEDD